MAEFQEVIRQWERRCEHCDKYGHIGCGVNGYVCERFCKMRKYINPEFIERDVMQWAAEHPEPQYPTWTEWLSKQGFVELKDGQFVRQTENEYVYEYKTVAILTDKAAVPIPADIAEKLDIEPKEG